ncbi:hypothetical protein SNEBB_009553 [Seison nebaliae]|nr:hypothetical protein SNEBB_009553 [Seison nebaliae]
MLIELSDDELRRRIKKLDYGIHLPLSRYVNCLRNRKDIIFQCPTFIERILPACIAATISININFKKPQMFALFSNESECRTFKKILELITECACCNELSCNNLEDSVILVGTMRSFLHIITNNYLINFNFIKLLYIDEIDDVELFTEVIHENFFTRPQVIVGVSNVKRDPKVLAVIYKSKKIMLRRPMTIMLHYPMSMNNSLEYKIEVNDQMKFNYFYKIIDELQLSHKIVFFNNSDDLEKISSNLCNVRFGHLVLSPNDTLEDRHYIISNFLNKSTVVMLTTDDLVIKDDININLCIINYDVPPTENLYINRCARISGGLLLN